MFQQRVVSISTEPVLDSLGYTAGDVLFESVELMSINKVRRTWLDGLRLVWDLTDAPGVTLLLIESDSGAPFIGTRNNAPSVSYSTLQEGLVGLVEKRSSDYKQIGGLQVASYFGEMSGVTPHGTGNKTLYMAGIIDEDYALDLSSKLTIISQFREEIFLNISGVRFDVSNNQWQVTGGGRDSDN